MQIAGVISKGLRGAESLLLKFLFIFGAQLPPKFLYQSYFSNGLYGIAMMKFLTIIWLLRSL